MTNRFDPLQRGAKNEASLRALFAEDPERGSRLSARACGLYLDYSKQRISDRTFAALIDLLEGAEFCKKRGALFDGQVVNQTENRPALHMALRGGARASQYDDQVQASIKRCREFADKIRSKQQIKSIVHLGIGGSSLGPKLAADVLRSANASADIELRFAENVDGDAINAALEGLSPANTLVIGVSKSFGTQETKMNSLAAISWLGKYTATNFLAVTANKPLAIKMGVKEENIFEFWDWVGGRFSLWSAVNLSLMIAFGPEKILATLNGAREMDAHFLSAAPGQNLPVLLALIDILNHNGYGFASRAVVPYADRLSHLPSFLQQLEMESCGKSVDNDGRAAGQSGVVIWGGAGTNGQHAFFQHLHQSPQITPVDFIGAIGCTTGRRDHHNALLANMIAQSEALLVGSENTDSPHKSFSGNRPSTTILMETLDAYHLGALIAMYEHKVFTASVIWDINPFDQWGVELGKVLAGSVLQELLGGDGSPHDSSTKALIALARAGTAS